jgi:hypothetical protein
MARRYYVHDRDVELPYPSYLRLPTRKAITNTDMKTSRFFIALSSLWVFVYVIFGVNVDRLATGSTT